MNFTLNIKAKSRISSAQITLIPDEPMFVFSLPSITRKWTRSNKRLSFCTSAMRMNVKVNGEYKGVFYSGDTLLIWSQNLQFLLKVLKLTKM